MSVPQSVPSSLTGVMTAVSARVHGGSWTSPKAGKAVWTSRSAQTRSANAAATADTDPTCVMTRATSDVPVMQANEEPAVPAPRTAQRRTSERIMRRHAALALHDKENIAPVRSVSQEILAHEARAEADTRAQRWEAIAMRTRARCSVVSERERAPSEAPSDDATSDVWVDLSDQAEEQPAEPPLTPRRHIPTPTTTPTIHTPSRTETPRKRRCIDLLTPPATPTPQRVCKARVEATSPRKEASKIPICQGNVYAAARALLRDGPLVGRARERARLHAFLDASRAAPQSLYVSGMPGTGKTAMVSAVLAERDAPHVLVNCVELTHPNEVLVRVLRALQAPPELELLETALSKHAGLVIVLDEMDSLLASRAHQDVLYRLFCLPARAGVTLIGLANSLDLTERFVPQLRSRGVVPVLQHMTPPGADEMCTILEARLRPLPDAPVTHSALLLLARKLTAVSGDVRRALDTCRQALDAAEAEHHATGAAVRVSPTHVLRVLSHMAGNAQVARVRLLGVHAKLLLLAWAVLQDRAEAGLGGLRTDGGVRLHELQATYVRMLEADAGFVAPLESSELLDVLERLEIQGLVRVYTVPAGGGSTSNHTNTNNEARQSGRVSSSGRRAAARQLLAMNRCMVPAIERACIVKALTGGAASAASGAAHTQAVVDAMCRVLRRESDAIARATVGRASAAAQAERRRDELGGGRLGHEGAVGTRVV